jgi:hypothetical protein
MSAFDPKLPFVSTQKIDSNDNALDALLAACIGASEPNCPGRGYERQSIVSSWASFLSEPIPARFIALRAFDSLFNFLSYESKLRVGSVQRSNYGFGLLEAGRLAASLA